MLVLIPLQSQALITVCLWIKAPRLLLGVKPLQQSLAMPMWPLETHAGFRHTASSPCTTVTGDSYRAGCWPCQGELHPLLVLPRLDITPSCGASPANGTWASPSLGATVLLPRVGPRVFAVPEHWALHCSGSGHGAGPCVGTRLHQARGCLRVGCSAAAMGTHSRSHLHVPAGPRCARSSPIQPRAWIPATLQTTHSYTP